LPTNTILTIGMVTRELLDAFDTNRVFTKHIYNEFSSEFAQPGAKIGPTLNVRLPARLAVTSGPVMTPSDYLEESTPLTIDQQEKVGLSFTSFEMALSMDDWRKRVGEPTSIVLSNKVDAYGLGLYWKCPNAILSPSTGSAKWLAYLNAGAIMADNGAPADGDWTAILNQYEQAQVVNENKGLFNPGTDIGTQNTRGMMGESAGLTWYWDRGTRGHPDVYLDRHGWHLDCHGGMDGGRCQSPQTRRHFHHRERLRRESRLTQQYRAVASIYRAGRCQ